jgi:guanylate kinase
VIGPSAAGKSTLAGAFVATRPDYQLVLTHTTRPSRPGESGSHIFVSDQEFDQTDFLGTLKIFGWRYGLPAWQGTATPLLVLRQGALDQFGALFSRFKVIQVEAPVEVLMARLARRETSLNSAGQAASEGSNRADPAALSTEIALGRRAAGRIVSTDQPFAQALAEFSQALADA